MYLQRFDHIQDFGQAVQAYLRQNAAENNLLLGVLHTLLHNPERYTEPPYLAIARTNNEILAVAIRTPPHKLLLSKAADLTALHLIAQDYYQQYQMQLPGFMGLTLEAEHFGQEWQTLTGQSSQLTVAMRIHQLTTVQLTAKVPGSIRLATESDRSLLRQWILEFRLEIGEVFNEDVEKVIDSGLRFQEIYLWEDGEPVSIAAGRAADPLARIGLVYTPPAYRNQGYATACVAAVSQKLLDQGYPSCFLLTDLENPTSNHIYQQIGYRGVCDWQEYSCS
jgi:predicted GNAT family acetyltransferase